METDVSKWTVGKLHDWLLETMGIGEFDLDDPDYGPWKVKQTAILKRVMKYRHVSVPEVVMCAEYCKASRIQPPSAPGLLYFIDEARRWSRQREALTTLANQDAELQEALMWEHQFADELSVSWMERLLRTTPSNRAEVVAEWKRERLHG